MKIRLRLTLTLTLQRSPQDEDDTQPPHVDDKPGTATELAWPAPVGFAIPPTTGAPERTDQ